MITPLYGCSQPDLYSACRLAWNLCSKNLAAFIAFSLQYSEAFVAANLAAVNAADFMLDLPARTALAKSAKEDLNEAKAEVIFQYGLLTAYIKKVFPAAKYDLMLDESGWAYLSKASVKGAWSSTAALIGSAVPFLDKYADVFADSKVVPPTFVDTFKATAKDFNEKVITSKNADAAASEGGDGKVIANNAIYTATIDMLEDGKKNFRKNPDLAKQFTWATFVAQTHGVKNAGFGGKVTDEDNPKLGIAATVVVKNNDKTVTSDTEGRYEFGPLSMGDYSATFSATGYDSKTIDAVGISTGVTTRLNVALTKTKISGALNAGA